MPRENQHYVPQFLLRNFCAEGQCHVFDKSTCKEFRTNPRNIMGEADYNVVRLKGNFYLDFESKFTHVENLAKPVLESIIANETVSALSPMDLATLCCFVVVQHLRSKSSRQSYSGIFQDVKLRFPDLKTNDIPEHFSDEEYEKFCLLKMNLDKLDEIAGHLTTKKLILLKKCCAGELYISDNALVMHNYNDFGPYGNIGLGVPGIEIYLPISSDLVLGFLCPTIIDGFHKERAKAEQKISEIQLKVFVDGALPLQSGVSVILDAKERLEQAKMKIAMLVDSQYAPKSKDILIFLNALQIQWANRFIAARRKDFSFAHKVMKEKPHWREHPRIEVA
ncbi:DUF4238 domain-containing protein [Mesorhizobium sp. M0185]|uniref:DUF4238 domain-containing protein n=1 Tax=Mesorhizobium sp. M0185 TaxID=2956907 RepID=UPI0033356F1B